MNVSKREEDLHRSAWRIVGFLFLFSLPPNNSIVRVGGVVVVVVVVIIIIGIIYLAGWFFIFHNVVRFDIFIVKGEPFLGTNREINIVV